MECEWQMVVLISNENWEFCGIRIVEVVWKVVELVANCWMGAAVGFHYTLYNFRSCRGMGDASLEVKLLQKL